MRKILKAGCGVLLAFTLAAPLSAQSRGGAVGRHAPAQNVPGLGFDYVHLAAVTPPSRVSRPDRHTGSGSFITPILTWGFAGYSAPEPVAPQPVVIVLQQPPPSVVVVPAPGSGQEAAAAEVIPPPPASPAQAPLRELGPFILVRHDGRVVFAVAFSVSGDRLTYITNEGIRRIFPLSELDTETTLQMNEAAGRSLTLPG